MHTNGGAKKPDWWKQLATVIKDNGDVTFSVDGLKDTNHLYRQNVNWDIVDQSMRAYIEGGGKVRWDYLIFDHNQHQVEEAEQYAKSIGVHKFQAKKTGRFISASSEKKDQHQAVNRKGKETTLLKKPEQKYQNKELSKQDILIEKYGSMDKYYDKAPIWCKVKDEGSLYISAEGLALPCCWTAGRMYKWWHKDPKVEQIWDYIDSAGGKNNLDATQHGLEKVFTSGIFDKIEESWNIDGCENGKLKVCAMKCGKEFDPFTSQFA
jgi:MoaA/NifB/PqqE/SkfB family radical SAM enzyme